MDHNFSGVQPPFVTPLPHSGGLKKIGYTWKNEKCSKLLEMARKSAEKCLNMFDPPSPIVGVPKMLAPDGNAPVAAR